MSRFIESIAYAVSARSREKKFRQFLDLMHPAPEASLLDVGVNTREYSLTDNYLEKHYPFPSRITAVGLEDGRAFSERYPNITYRQTTLGTPLPFPDHAFTFVYSNAVIEHVGRHAEQLFFLQELMRVARHGYVTTPNRYFPVETHTRVPLLHILLPKRIFDRTLIWIGKSWATGDYMHCLSGNELRALCHEAGLHDFTLIPNRFCGLTLTWTLIWHTTS